MAGLLSKGITLSYKASGDTYTDLTNLQEIPEIGNGTKEKIDVTVLSDSSKKSIAGLGDSAQDLAFKFLYDKTQFATLAALTGSKGWKVGIPDGTDGAIGTTATFDGTPSVKLSGAGVNGALTYTLTITVESEITFA